MARTRYKCLFIFCSLVISVSTRSLPLIRESTSQISITNEVYTSSNNGVAEDATVLDKNKEIIQEIQYDLNTTGQNRNEITINNIRPGQSVSSYTIELTREGENFRGKAVIDVSLTDQTLGNVMRFNVMGLDIGEVLVGVVTADYPQPAETGINNDVLEIRPRQGQAATYIVIISYNVPLRNDGTGIFMGKWDDNEYIAMNLHPTYARRVFPCMDEPNLSSRITSFTFNDMGDFARIISNSQLDEESTYVRYPKRIGMDTGYDSIGNLNMIAPLIHSCNGPPTADSDWSTFTSLPGPVHRWAMVAHNLNPVNPPVPGLVHLYVRQGTNQQEVQASVAINHFYNALNEWTDVEHRSIHMGQDGGLHVMALPDVARDWYGLSTLCIWEPYILMENNNAVKQRKTALVTIAEGMARQWFGWALFPENWRDQWVTAGLASYAAYEIAKDFQTPREGHEDPSLIDMDAIFTTDVIQESLLYDAYASATSLRLKDPIFEENQIRQHTQGLLKTKAPALLRMTRLVLSEERDLVQTAARGLLARRSSQWVTTRSLYDGLTNGYGSDAGSGLVNSVDEFLRPWVENEGYPVISVSLRRNGVQLTQERFGFTPRQHMEYTIPLTFTTSSEPNFDNLFPMQMMRSTMHNIDVALEEEDWIIFNLQGQGYYRVNYEDTWDRLIGALSDPDARGEIHPLNRAVLLDDALNLARAKKLQYATALEIALTMELETEYAVWKAYVRNMDFIKKRLLPFVEHDDERGDDIYLRMVRRTIVAVKEEIGFEPEAAEPAMVSLTRGLVMEHACKVGYEPCVAAAVDIFYDPNEEGEINPNIPPEIRPAVYCTMIREDEEDEVREALENHLPQVQSRYERLVVLESLACSPDGGFIQSLLEATVSDSEYNLVLEERSKIFAAVASSSSQNSAIALTFLIERTQPIREMYGGPDKLEEAIFIMSENIVNGFQANQSPLLELGNHLILRLTETFFYVGHPRLHFLNGCAKTWLSSSTLYSSLVINFAHHDGLKEAVLLMSENMTLDQISEVVYLCGFFIPQQFSNWVNSQNEISRLDDSIEAARRARHRINENLSWMDDNLEEIYQWIDENDASSIFASTLLLCLSLCIALFNQH